MPAVLLCAAQLDRSNMNRSLLTVLLTLATLAGNSPAQQPPPAPPATAPVVPPYTLVMPSGYEKVSVAGHTAICLPADAEWVRKALGDAKPATRPTTMPADLIKRVTDNRAAVVKQMVAELALADEKQANRAVDEQIITTPMKRKAIMPSIYFLTRT